MAIDFPSSPNLNDTYTFGTTTYVWNGTAWRARSVGYQGSQGPIGYTGSRGTTGYNGSQGATGFVGSQGRGYSGVASATAMTIPTSGSKSFGFFAAGVGTGAYAVGSRVRASADANNYMEGVITSVTTDSNITVNVDITVGSGSFGNWTFSLIGSTGYTGSQGGIGPMGYTGSQGIIGYTGSKGIVTAADITTTLGYTPVQQGGGTGQGTNKVYIGYIGSNGTMGLHVDATNFGYTWPINVTGNAATAGTATYLSATQQTNAITGATTSMAMSQDSGATKGSFIARATGTGDTNLAGMTFWNDAYAIKMGVRADGYIGMGGWSRAAWSWYSDPSGNMVAAGNVTAYSDPRLKENVTLITDPVGIVKQLNGVRFNWKSGITHTENKAGKADIGILATDVEAVLPELITTSIELDGDSYKTVAYDKLVAVLIEAVKEQQISIEKLQQQVKSLSGA